VKNSGGMIGLRTGSEATKSHGKVPNDCDGSTKSFAQAYEYGISKGIPTAFGSDFNGFIQQLRPRFGGEKESCGATGDKKTRRAQQKLQGDRLHKSFDQSGFGHIGQIGDIIAELQNFGVDTSVIENSSEIFIQMWEKAHPKQTDFPMMRAPASLEMKSAL
jgi:microsomal dipeptidase-like Zn-dependent dipeptidase